MTSRPPEDKSVILRQQAWDDPLLSCHGLAKLGETAGPNAFHTCPYCSFIADLKRLNLPSCFPESAGSFAKHLHQRIPVHADRYAKLLEG